MEFAARTCPCAEHIYHRRQGIILMSICTTYLSAYLRLSRSTLSAMHTKKFHRHRPGSLQLYGPIDRTGTQQNLDHLLVVFSRGGLQRIVVIFSHATVRQIHQHQVKWVDKLLADVHFRRRGFVILLCIVLVILIHYSTLKFITR